MTAPRSSTLIVLAGASLIIVACARKPNLAPAVPVAPRGITHLDLQPAWRLRVVAGLSKVGGGPYQTTLSGSRLTVTLPKDELPSAYERAYYAVTNRNGCLAVRPGSAEIVRKGQPAPILLARVATIPKLSCAKHLRLVYSLAVSNADHQMAILGANDRTKLDAVTVQLQTDPDRACRDTKGLACRWIPQGVSVQAERPAPAGVNAWVDAR